MENYIVINGKKTELTEDQLRTLGIKIENKLEDVPVGEVVNIAGVEWIVLEHKNGETVCLTKDFVYENTKFDNGTNNFSNSDIRCRLNTVFLKEITDAIGADNIVVTEIDLTSDDGLDDYGKVFVKVGLLTCDQYRKYNRIIEKYPVNDWWWLATPWSTPYRGISYSVRCVRCNGALDYYDCDGNCGVRPFCIFRSSIFVS